MYNADLGLTLVYGIVCGIPAILAAKFLLSGQMKKIRPEYLKEYVPKVEEEYEVPGVKTALTVALLPVLLIGGGSLLQAWIGKGIVTETLGNPALAMLIAVLAGVYFLGIRTGRTMKQVGKILIAAVSGVAVVLLIISGAGALKQIMIDTGISEELGEALGGLGMPPLIMAWVIAALIRISLGSATVAGLTAGAIMVPLLGSSDVSPELLVLATGAGSITFSHINDGGFWLFKEYFNVSIKETLLSWSLMETTVSVVGLLCVLLLSLVI
jgi:Gnt-I system high-affinity gluconate transporter